MFRVEWDQTLATGVAEIDEQHKEIFARFNALLEACDRGRSRELLADVMEFMNNYVLEHFRDEERLQASVGYPQLADHQRVHEELGGRFLQLQEKVAAHGATVQLVIETCKLLSEVLFEHIHLYDKALAEFLLRRHNGPAGNEQGQGEASR
jgi:hemerythrin